MHSGSWFAILSVLAGLIAINLICWAPGVGTSDGTIAGRPRGTDLERFFGWPAQYRAELWHSDDPSLADRILRVAPFYSPGREMVRQVRYVGLGAIVINFLFAMMLSGLAAIIVEHFAFGVWHRWFLWLGLLLLVCLGALLLGAGHVGVHL